MFMDILILFIIITLIMFFISVFLVEDKPMIAFPFIMIGMVFSILCTYGMWDVEYLYIGYNSTIGNTSSYVYSTTQYGDPYSYIFVLFFFIFMILFFRAGFVLWKEALETPGQMKYRR